MSLSLIAYRTNKDHDVPIVPASMRRQWMTEETQGHAYHCLPLNIANQAGWFLLNPYTFTVTWYGVRNQGGLTIEFEDQTNPKQWAFAQSHFGDGILTFRPPYLFRTSAGYNLHVRGPVNEPREGIQALEGIVETDWANQLFTMNWKITRPNYPITFRRGDSFCMIVPTRRDAIEQFEADVRDIESNPVLHTSYQHYVNQRRDDYARHAAEQQQAEASGKKVRTSIGHHYLHGETSEGNVLIDDHRTALELDHFRDEWDSQFKMSDNKE